MPLHGLRGSQKRGARWMKHYLNKWNYLNEVIVKYNDSIIQIILKVLKKKKK